MINESRLINSFITMAQIPSISGREGKMRDYLRAQLQERGLEVNEDEAGLALQGEAGNLWVKIPASVTLPMQIESHWSQNGMQGAD
jgi:tripeptide aminopeptidase